MTQHVMITIIVIKIQLWRKFIKRFFLNYADLECLLIKMHSCQNNLEKSYTEKKLSIRLLVTPCLQIGRLI